MYEDDEQEDQTKPRMRGTDPAAMQRGGPMMQTMMGGGGGAPGGMPGRPQMPWHQPQQGQPDWGSILQRFQQRFQQHNPFAQRMGGGAAPGGMPPGGAPMQGPPQGANPWADRIAAAASRFGGNRQPGGIIPPGRGY